MPGGFLRLHRLPSLAASGAAALLLVCVAAPGEAQKAAEAPIPPLPISIAVAAVEGKAVRDDTWIDAQIAQASRIFGEHGLRFARARTRALSPAFARLETRKDRDALAAELDKGVINVFVVASLRDVDDPTLLRQGVHWRPRGALHKHYAILSMVAQETTLAHELGHFLGNGHTTVIDNLMSYERTSVEATFLSDEQGKKARRFARIYLRSREILTSILPAPAT